MALQDQKITSSDLANKGVVGLPDTPNLSTLVMQQKFDEIATAVIVPKFNALIDYLIESLAPIVSDNPQDGEVLIYFADSSQYKNGVYRTTLSALKDVNVGGVQNKMFLCYDADRDLWYPEASSGVMETISACKDVSIVNPQTGDIFKFDGTAWANMPDERGLLIVFNIDSEDGATITALTPSGDTVTATYLGDGNYIIKSDEYGEWHLTGEKNGETVEATIDVDVAKIYDVTMNFFAATITVTYPADATVTCSKDSEEYTATGSPYTFTVHGSGDWVIEGTRSGITETQTVTITTNGQSESVTLTILPDGSTVTPTDSIPTLLHCADIWDKSYTSIGEVLDDSDSLFKVLTTDNSIDYLVRSTTYASSVTADEDAMAIIGSYDYCANTLLSDSTWLTAIVGSAYFESVDNLKVPKMTSNNTPSGEVSSDSSLNSGYYPWKAFNGTNSDASDCWHSAQGSTHWIQYKFANKTIKVNKISITTRYSGNQGGTVNVNFKRSSDGETISSFSYNDSSANTTYDFPITADNSGDTCRLEGTISYWQIGKLQFYGRENGGVQTWLRAGGIDKDYTTLAEVLADTTTLSALISNHNAVDYLVTAKGLIDGIVADATAMSYIGLNNYCANTLLADEDWLTAIINSAYVDSVCNVKVPTMTSNTTPSGTCIGSSKYDSSDTYNYYKAFNGNTSQKWNSAGSGSTQYVGYVFTSPVEVKGINTNFTDGATTTTVITAKVCASNDGSSWVDVSDTFGGASSNNNVLAVVNTQGQKYTHYIMQQVSGTKGMASSMVQFYGRVDV